LASTTSNTHYVLPAPPQHPVSQRYTLLYADLVDPLRPWRHDPDKLARAILRAGEMARASQARALQ
jgi:hypothetical protein